MDNFNVKIRNALNYNRFIDSYNKVKKKMRSEGIEDMARYKVLMYLFNYYLRGIK